MACVLNGCRERLIEDMAMAMYVDATFPPGKMGVDEAPESYAGQRRLRGPALWKATSEVQREFFRLLAVSALSKTWGVVFAASLAANNVDDTMFEPVRDELKKIGAIK